MSKEMDAAAESEDFDQVLRPTYSGSRPAHSIFHSLVTLPSPFHQAAALDESISVKNQELDLVRLQFHYSSLSFPIVVNIECYLLQLLSELGCERSEIISKFCEDEA
jgi:hypothetical protein